VLFGHRIKSVALLPDGGGVEAILEGQGGQEVRFEGSCMVAADGAHSMIR
jgi:2-polyprenyl-6-methoxyphenol hydroxylase-like FAD-dependent oxidoreductase